MVSLALIAGFYVAVGVAGVVFVDATRRQHPPKKRLTWSAGVGAVSFGGFLVPHLYADAFHYVYLQRLKPVPVVSSPSEILMLHLATGVIVSALAVVGYGLGRR